MRGEQMLRLYPRAWRDRYGDEFLATVGTGPLHAQQVVDIVSGAIDAWLSADVRRATVPASSPSINPHGRRPMIPKALLACDRQMRFTTRDGLAGAAAMLGSSFLLVAIGIAARRAGWPATGEVITSLSFPVAMVVSMPFWLMKGQPWKAQAVIIGVTLAILIGFGYLSTRI